MKVVSAPPLTINFFILTKVLPLAAQILFVLVVSAAPSSGSGGLSIDLTYDAGTNLYTLPVSVGSLTESQRYNMLLDTGSAFLLLQESRFQKTSTTKILPDMPIIKGSFETASSDGTGAVKDPKISFVQDQVRLLLLGDYNNNPNSRSKSEWGAKGIGGQDQESPAIVGTAKLPQLKLDGIVGFGPPFSTLQPPPPASASNSATGRGASAGGGKGGGGGGGTGGGGGGGASKSKRDSSTSTSSSSSSKSGGTGSGTGSSSSSSTMPSTDVSFLHAFLTPSNKAALGITASHFYITLNGFEGGQLVFPAGETCPSDVPGYDFSRRFQVDANTGSTYPNHAFWGIAHRRDLLFTVDGRIVPDVKVDAVLLDSGTSGIVGPREEVEKLFGATGGKVTPKRVPTGTNKEAEQDYAMFGEIDCGIPASDIQMGFNWGGKDLVFVGMRVPPSMLGGREGEVGSSPRKMDPTQSEGIPGKHRSGEGKGEISWGSPLTLDWKSYSDQVTSTYQKVGGMVKGVVGDVASIVGSVLGGVGGGIQLTQLNKRHQASTSPRSSHRLYHHHYQYHRRSSSSSSSSTKQFDPNSETKQAGQQQQPPCQSTVLGSSSVEKMFPPTAPNQDNPKVWIVGQEFFQENLVYHNIDSTVTTVVPRKR